MDFSKITQPVKNAYQKIKSDALKLLRYNIFMPLASSLLESKLNLSIAEISQPSPELLIISSKMTSVRLILAIVLALASLIFLIIAWKNWNEFWLAALWPWGFLSFFFFIVSIPIFFGEERKSFNLKEQKAIIEGKLGPWNFSESISLPKEGKILIRFHKEYSSTSQNHTAMPTRHYMVSVNQEAKLSFETVNDREAARDFAKRLSEFLNYPVQDEVEDDGVERVQTED